MLAIAIMQHFVMYSILVHAAMFDPVAELEDGHEEEEDDELSASHGDTPATSALLLSRRMEQSGASSATGTSYTALILRKQKRAFWLIPCSTDSNCPMDCTKRLY